MCGIVGIIRNGKCELISELRSALDSMVHRGPDDSGVWDTTVLHHGNTYSVGLGHVRLAIIDLSKKGHQPMFDGENMIISYNGEIYNYLELRQELRELGYDFTTDSDTEVVLASYRQWGEACVERFIGMWAFAIWNGHCLYLSRDRLGKKPLYVYHDEKGELFAFASEIKGFRKITGVPWRPDERTVFRYLAYSEMERGGHTFYKNICELTPGSYITYIPGESEIHPQRYWHLSDHQCDIDEQEAINRTSELLIDSLRLRLRSDALVGLSLSGGLDSTLLLSLINELGIYDLPVFSAGYEELGYSETRFIEIATKHLSCDPNATASAVSGFTRDFERIIHKLDQPSKLPGSYSLWRVAELASEQIKVLIDGQGADELAGGYMYFLPVSWHETPFLYKIRQSPDLLFTIWENRHILHQYSFSLIWERLKGTVSSQRRLPLRPSWMSEFGDERPVWEETADLNSTLRYSITDRSLPALLRYSDRLNMAFGVENRSPFLDHRLVEYVAALPARMKIRGGTTKWIFRAIAKGRVPQPILKRRMKMGFPTPVGVWLREKIREVAREWFSDYDTLKYFNCWIDVKEVHSILDEHATGKVDHNALLWRLLSVGAWLKINKIE